MPHKILGMIHEKVFSDVEATFEVTYRDENAINQECSSDVDSRESPRKLWPLGPVTNLSG